MARKIKDAARELGVDRQKLIDFYRTELKKSGANKNTPIDDLEFEAAKAKFGKGTTATPVVTTTQIQTQHVQLEKNESVSTMEVEAKAVSASTSKSTNDAISDDLKLRAEILSDETSKLVVEEGVSPKPLNGTEQKMLDKAESPAGFKKYLEFLENTNKNLNGLLEKRDEREKAIIEKQNAKLAEIETIKKEWDEKKSSA